MGGFQGFRVVRFRASGFGGLGVGLVASRHLFAVEGMTAFRKLNFHDTGPENIVFVEKVRNIYSHGPKVAGETGGACCSAF